MFLNFFLNFEFFQFEIFLEGRETSLKNIQIINLQINASGIKYNIFLHISQNYITIIIRGYTSLRAFHRSSCEHQLEGLQLLSTKVLIFETQFSRIKSNVLYLCKLKLIVENFIHFFQVFSSNFLLQWSLAVNYKTIYLYLLICY